MAPALIIGFNGRPVPGSRLIELNASTARLDPDPRRLLRGASLSFGFDRLGLGLRGLGHTSVTLGVARYLGPDERVVSARFLTNL